MKATTLFKDYYLTGGTTPNYLAGLFQCGSQWTLIALFTINLRVIMKTMLPLHPQVQKSESQPAPLFHANTGEMR